MQEAKTPEQIRQDFKRRGDTLAAFARRNGYKPYQVYTVMSGVFKGNYGRAHEIAVKLGLKENVSEAA